MIKHNKREVFLSSLNCNEFPDKSMSTKIVTTNRTGDWRDYRPFYEEKIAPCNSSCPAGEDIRGYISLFKKGKYIDALNLIRESNPLPSVCGRVCFNFCEHNCNRKELDEAISIHGIERFLSDYGNSLKYNFNIHEVIKNGKKVAVIGSGPSGLSCAYQLTRMGYQVTIYEKYPVIGGKLRVAIPEYRLPKSVLDFDIKYIMDCGVEIRTNVTIGKDLLFKELQLSYDAIFIGIGAQLDQKIGILGEDTEGIISGLHFMKQLNSSIPIPLGEKVAVIGGGYTAIDCARSARRSGSTVKIIYRRSQNERLASASEISEAEQEGIEFIYLTSPIKAHLKNGKLSQIECVRMHLGEPDEGGRKRPIPIEGSNFLIEVNTVIAAIGEYVDSSLLITNLATAANGTIYTNNDGLTNYANVYAGGDAINQPRTVVHAIASGRKAAVSIDGMLQNNTINHCNDAIKIVSYDDITPSCFQSEKRAKELLLPIKERTSNFEEINQGFSEDIAIKEVNRCFSCGLCTECNSCLVYCPDISVFKDMEGYKIDYDHCKGCGVCVEECPSGVLSMEIEKKSGF